MLSESCVTMMLYICMLPVFEALVPHCSMRSIFSGSMGRSWYFLIERWLSIISSAFCMSMFGFGNYLIMLDRFTVDLLSMCF